MSLFVRSFIVLLLGAALAVLGSRLVVYVLGFTDGHERGGSFVIPAANSQTRSFSSRAQRASRRGRTTCETIIIASIGSLISYVFLKVGLWRISADLCSYIATIESKVTLHVNCREFKISVIWNDSWLIGLCFLTLFKQYLFLLYLWFLPEY